MVSSFLELLGMLLIVTAAGLAFGVPSAVFIAGVCCLVSSLALTRARR